MTELAITELVELDAQRVDGVGSPANGTPFILIKGQAEKADASNPDNVDCKLCSGTGKIRAGHVICPDCKGSGKVSPEFGATQKSDSAEADQIEELVTGEAAKDLSDAERDKMPASQFAYVDPAGGKHLPIHDKAHVQAAIGRFNQTDFSAADDPDKAKAAAAGKIKSAAADQGVDLSDDSNVAQAAKGQVQDALNGLNAPMKGGQFPASNSGLAGPVTDGTAGTPGVTSPNTPSTAPGVTDVLSAGQSAYNIPDQGNVNGSAVKQENFERPNGAEPQTTPQDAGGVASKAGENAGSTTSEEDNVMAVEVTKEELAEAISAGSIEAVKAQMDAIKAEVLEAIKQDATVNNTTSDLKPNGQIDEKLNGVPAGGAVNDQYINKGLANLVKEAFETSVKPEIESLKDQVAKMGQRPRLGGPILDGQPHIAVEGSQALVKGDDTERLEKSFAEATDPLVKAQLGEQLTHARLMAAVSQRG